MSVCVCVCVCVCVGDVLGVVRLSLQYVDKSFSHLCAQLTAAGWLITPVLLAADEWRVQWTHHHHHHHQQQQQRRLQCDDDDKKLF